MYTIGKKFTFSASHQLLNVPEGHPCRNLHGHNYTVELIFRSETLNNWFVIDYRDLQPFKEMLDEVFDHKHLNDIIPVPSAENLAMYFFIWASNRWPEAHAARVSETEKTWAEYTE